MSMAKWCDEEYQLLCMLPSDGKPESRDTLVREGQRAALGMVAHLLRSWAATGNMPPHQKVRDDWRAVYERRLRDEDPLP